MEQLAVGDEVTVRHRGRGVVEGHLSGPIVTVRLDTGEVTNIHVSAVKLVQSETGFHSKEKG